MHVGRWFGAAMLALVMGCARQHAEPSGAPVANADAPATQAPRGTFLAYEHHVTVRLPGKDIAARINTIEAACFAQTFGDCAVLNVEQRGGDFPGGNVTMRIAPKGVEPMIQRGASGGDIESRNVSAEDLAEAVQDNAVKRDRLEREHDRLLEFQSSPNVKLADMLALSKQLAEVEAALEEAKRESAQQQRRIDTNLLSMEFESTGLEAGRSDIRDAFRDAAQIMATSTAWLIRTVAALIPLTIVLVLIVMGWRRWLRPRRALDAPANTGA